MITFEDSINYKFNNSIQNGKLNHHTNTVIYSNFTY